MRGPSPSVIDDEELGKDYSGLCLRGATAMATRAGHGGHGLRLASAVGMLYNAGHMPWSHTHEERNNDLRLCGRGGLGGQGPREM